MTRHISGYYSNLGLVLLARRGNFDVMGSTVFRSDQIAEPETVGDAAQYIMDLPKAEHRLPHWVTAIEWLMLVGDHSGDPMAPRPPCPSLARLGLPVLSFFLWRFLS
jgi:hypothetical protein